MYKKLISLIFLVVVLSAAGTVSADLVAHWMFDDAGGDTAFDMSGNGADGTLTGNPDWTVGPIGGALSLANAGDYVQMPNSEAIKLRSTGTYTVACWLNIQSPTGAIVYHGLGCSTWASWFLGLGGPEPDAPRQEGNLVFGVRSANGSAYTSVAAPTVADAWIHVAATYDGSTLTLYLDGEERASETAPAPFDSTEDLYVGGDPGCGGRNWYEGAIDDLRIYDNALSGGEVMAVMQGKAWPFAFGPEPEDGAILEATWANIKWQPGQLAVSHDVYIGTSLEDVEAGAESTFVGNQAAANLIVGFVGFPFAEGLVPGTTYYWRVDEVNDADPNSPWKGDVWSFWVPSKKTYGAVPTQGMNFVKTDATVSWSTGFGGKLTQMYFGTDADEVDAGTGGTAKGPVVGTTYDPGPLEKGTTYYWRVDQFDGADTHKGDVWSFTTVPDIAVGDPALLGWWTLDEGEGTTAVDWSGHGGHGSFVGDPQWTYGYQGSALEFDGAGEYVNCGDDTGADATGDFTLAAWVQMAPGNSDQYMGIGGRLMVSGGIYTGFALVRHTTNVFRLWVGDNTDDLAKSGVSSDAMYTDTEWHHVAGVHEGRANFLYVDGVKQAGSTMIDFVPSVQFFHIAKQYANTDERYFKGKIDDVRLYNKALTEAEIAEVMHGDTNLAGNPVPGRDAVLDIRDISSLSWSRGSTASSHDVYLGTDRGAVAGADNSSPQFHGNQARTTLSLAGLVEFGGGDYYWRVDEVETDGTVHAGTVWKFTVPDYLIVDNFESYNNIDPPNDGSNRIFDNWIDGFGTTTNGALVGNDLPPYGEHGIVQAGNQSMKYRYDNAGKTSEATLTVAKGDWTAEGVTKLVLQVRGASGNAPDRIYVALNGTAVIYHDDASATQLTGWNEWVIDLAAFGVDLANVNSITIGVGTKNTPVATGGTGTMYFDEILLTP
jgi:prepilin-type processing-associated H-X9-DG protein